jgi:hypothetical protein
MAAVLRRGFSATQQPNRFRTFQTKVKKLRPSPPHLRGVILRRPPVSDGRQVGLAAALSTLMGNSDGALLLCVPGKRGYYNPEDDAHGLILHRR